MSPIAGQTAGPNGLKIFVDTQGWPGGDIGQKKFEIFFFQIFYFFIFQKKKFHGQRRELQLVFNR